MKSEAERFKGPMGKGRAADKEDSRAAGSRGNWRARAKRSLEAQEEKEEIVPDERNKRKGNKQKKESTIPVQETRMARFLPKPSSAVKERISRAFSHRLYLIDKKLSKSASPDSPPSACDFFVLGATGNVYTVKLDLFPLCTCPDYAKGNTCKHILFVMLRVLKLPPDDPRVWQKALLPSELRALLHNLSVNDAVLASSLVRQRFKQITSESPTLESIETKSVQREIDGDCPICYEGMAVNDGKSLEPVVFCKTCGNNVHADCFKRWRQSKARGSVTCIYCRAVWEGDARADGEYINLASYSNAHKPEETSIEALYYPESYQWWRRYR